MIRGFNYMGNKFNLLKQIIPYFPKNINKFYDVFGGSGTVSMNIKANEIILNDFNNHVFNLYKMFKEMSSKEIIDYCYSMRDKYGFTVDETVKTKIAELNKIPFAKCRDDMNNNPTTLGYYFLTFYSFCNQFRFNSNGKFNMPCGNGYFKKDSEPLINKMCEFFKNKNLHIYNKDYETFEFDDFNKETDFIYLDPPYSANSNSVYNEKCDMEGWNEEQDKKFLSWCEKLNDKGYKFAMSNVFCNKGYVADYLQNWCKKNNFIVHHLNMKYASHGVDNNITDEVLICNYGKQLPTIFNL